MRRAHAFRSRWQKAHPRSILVKAQECACLELIFEASQNGKQCPREGIGGNVASSYLNDARPFPVSCGQDRSEVEIVGDHDILLAMSLCHDLAIRRVWSADLTPMRGFVPGCVERFYPQRGEIHVKEESHAVGSGTSISSTLQAAYVSASSMSAGSR